jgi:ABC-type transport system involved in multi-copper enzyme maturation permease subunit
VTVRPSQALALAAVLRRELREHVSSGRTAIGLLICVVLCGLTGWVRGRDFHEATLERNAFLQRWRDSVVEQIQRDEAVEVENTREISRTAALSVGLEPVMPFRFTCTKEGLRLGESRSARNIVDALFGSLDLAFVVGLLLPLLAIALTFDRICEERARGTLAVSLSYPVSRFTIFAGKTLAAAFTLTVCLLCGLASTAASETLAGGAPASVLRWLIFALAAALYMTGFAILGVAVSVWVRRASDSALICLLLWVLFSFVLPRIGSLVVSALHPPSHMVILALQEETEVSRLRVAYVNRLNAAYYARVNGTGSRDALDAEFETARKEAGAALARDRSAVAARIRSQVDRAEARRDELTTVIASVSPTAVFDRIASELAGTGISQRRSTLRQIRQYDDSIGRKLAESRQVFISLTSRDGGLAAMIEKADVAPYLIPFVPVWLTLRETASPIIVSLLLLAMFAIFFGAVGYVGLIRLDVRP